MSKTVAQFWAWLLLSTSKLMELVEKGKLALEQLEPIRLVVQAILDNKPVEVIVGGTKVLVQETSRVVGSFLRLLGPVTIPAITGQAKILAAGKDIWLGDNFKRWIATGLQWGSDLPETTWQSFETMKLAWDREIVSELPDGYVFKRHEFCAYMAHLVSLQPNGKAGILLSDGRANIFLVEDVNGVVRTVSVYWYSYSRRWGFGADEFDYRWRDGYRVFAATAP